MNLDIFNEDDWGPWLKAESFLFKNKDIFLLGRYGPEPGWNAIYMVIGSHKLDDYTQLYWRDTSNHIWSLGHMWRLFGATCVRLPKNVTFTVALNKECPCGIYRQDCDYHRS